MPIARFQECRQNEVGSKPFSSRFVRICRSSGDARERFLRDCVDRFASPAILDGEQAELFVIEFARVGRDRCLCPAQLGGKKQNREGRKDFFQGNNFSRARRFSQFRIPPPARSTLPRGRTGQFLYESRSEGFFVTALFKRYHCLKRDGLQVPQVPFKLSQFTPRQRDFARSPELGCDQRADRD